MAAVLSDYCRKNGTKRASVVIVGAGPVGCAAALAFARQGKKVLLLEASPKACQRFAGEWLHPPGVRALLELGVGLEELGEARGYGFVIWGRDQAPVELPYVRGMSIARHHQQLVLALRAHVERHENIDVLYGVRFLALQNERGQEYQAENAEQAPLEEVCVARLSDKKNLVEVAFDRLVGADGRNSNVRAALKPEGDSATISFMMGVELKGAQLPHEGLGHVIYGGPGPGLFYRIDRDTIRGCLDVPVALGAEARKKDQVREAFLPHLPAGMQSAFAASFETGSAWAATKFRARTFFGASKVWLAGDAAGHIHPITGMGMTLGILDAVALARATEIAEYEQERQAYIAELLTNVLYQVMSRHDESALRVRAGLFEMLRSSAGERRRTMRVLTGEDERGSSFVLSFLRAGATSLRRNLFEQLSVPVENNSRLAVATRAAELLRADLRWLKWPLSAAVSEVAGARELRHGSSFSEPIAELDRLLLRRWGRLGPRGTTP